MGKDTTSVSTRIGLKNRVGYGKEKEFELQTELRRALEKQEFQLHYQPIIDLEDSRMVGFEALLRWMHPERGVLYPAEFLHRVENAGLMAPLVCLCFQQLGQHIARWKAGLDWLLPVTVSMNISVQSLVSEGLIKEIDTLASENRFDCHTLRLEITENQIVANQEILARPLSQLSERGIGVIIDDFGTGYSFRYLARTPVCALKIAPSLISDLHSELNKRWLRGVVSLAHGLGLELIAKGVEEEDQLRILQESGCEYGQGNYFYPAQDQESALLMILEMIQRFRPREVEALCLRPFKLFAGLDTEKLDTIAEECKEITVPADTLIIRQGQVGSRIYLLEEGSVAVYRGEHGNEKFSRVLRAPTVIGEMAIVDPERIRTANVRSLTTVRLLSLPITIFLLLLRRIPSLGENFRQLLNERPRDYLAR